jgi:hypothetical protein
MLIVAITSIKISVIGLSVTYTDCLMLNFVMLVVAESSLCPSKSGPLFSVSSDSWLCINSDAANLHIN